MLSACGGGGGGSSPSSSDTTIPAGNRNSLRPVSSATDFTIQVGQAPRRHITSLNDQTTDAQTAQDHATGSQTTDSQDSSEQRQVEGQNVNNNGDTPSAPTGPNRDTPQTPNTDSAGSETDSAGGGTAPFAPTGSNTDTPQVPADTTPPATPRLSLVDTGTDASDGMTCNNQIAVSGLEDGLTINGGSDGWIASRPATDKAGDVLALDGEGLNLDLTKIKQNSIQDIEIIDLTGNGDNILALNIHDVIDITNDNNIVRVSGESGDKVISAGWHDTGTDKVVDGITYDVFKDNSDATLAELWVDQDIDVAGITADIL